MKKVFLVVVACVFAAGVLFSSCGASQTCPAYGNADVELNEGNC